MIDGQFVNMRMLIGPISRDRQSWLASEQANKVHSVCLTQTIGWWSKNCKERSGVSVADVACTSVRQVTLH